MDDEKSHDGWQRKVLIEENKKAMLSDENKAMVEGEEDRVVEVIPIVI